MPRGVMFLGLVASLPLLTSLASIAAATELQVCCIDRLNPQPGADIDTRNRAIIA